MNLAPATVVDLSHWQSVKGCDWPLAAQSGVKTAIVKLSGGTSVSDGGLLHMTKLLESGPIVSPGAYHFAVTKRGGWKRPEEQAETFVRAIEASGWEPPEFLFELTFTNEGKEETIIVPALYCDLEWQSFPDKVAGALFRRKVKAAQLLEFLRRFIGRTEALTGVPCGWYSGPAFIRYRLRRHPDLRLWWLWLAKYIPKRRRKRGEVPALTEWPAPVRLLDGWEAAPVLWQWGPAACEWYREGKGLVDQNMARVA